MTDDKRTALGIFEPVSFPKLGGLSMYAKIDTGAYTGALHCTKIREKQTAEGPALYFSPFDHPKIEVKSADFTIKTVRSSNGVPQKRYFITTEIEIKGKIYPIELSLADRSEMKWSVLIGRRFLRHNKFLVDVRQGTKYRNAR